MNVLSGSRLLLLSMTLLVGCRSEKAAFQFRPSAPAVGAAPPAAPVPATLTPVAPAARETPAAAVAAVRPAESSAASHRTLLRRPVLRQQREIQQTTLRKPSSHKQRPADEEGDLFHVVLGALVIVTGVLLGLLLGGWLGLGVGAAVVILGYYFLVLGIGGKHAWLEIFQEFFNM